MKRNNPLKVYLSGPITNDPRASVVFKVAQQSLEGLGFEVVNPLELNHDPSLSWTDCMRRDIAALMTCDAIYALQNWPDSRGARLEIQIACELALLFFNSVVDARLWLSQQEAVA